MDISYLLFLQQIRQSLGNVLDNFMLQMTFLGESKVTFLLLAGIYWCVNKRAGQYIWFNVSFGCTINQFLKNMFHVERPWIKDSRITPVESALASAGGYSFPSGHTARATAVWGAMGISAWQNKKKKGNGLAFFSWIILAMIIYSRNYLGVHTPQDVVVSFLIGIILLFLIDKVMNWVEADGNGIRDIIVTVIGCILLFLPMLRFGCLSNAGAGFGFLIGWIIERRYIKFVVEGTWQSRCLRFAIGGMLILLILTTLPAMLVLVMPSRYANFFTMFVLALFITAIYPLLFMNQRVQKIGIFFGIIAGVVLIASTAYMVHGQTKNEVKEAAVTDKIVVEETQQEEENEKITQETGTNIQIIAHRGYSSVFPENTLASFAGAIDIGADMIELDVQETKDGVIVVFHDDDLTRVAGVEGKILDYTYAELSEMEVGSWFSEEFRGEKIPTLAEVLQQIQDSDLQVYLELKDIGEVEGFEEAVLSVTQEYGMTERCIFASFQYTYLTTFKEIDVLLRTLLNTTSAEVTLPVQYEVDYFGLNLDVSTQELIDAIHAADKYAFVWTVNEPSDMRKIEEMGADGIVTNRTGLAKIVTKSEYSFLIDYYSNAITMPGLYGNTLTDTCEDMVVQGFTQAEENLVITAYSYSGENNSILYILDTEGKLQKTINLGFKAHVGGVAYDAEHGIIWITGANGSVYSLLWQDISAAEDGGQAGAIMNSIDVGLINHNNAKVASFLTVNKGKLYVGSYVDGDDGRLVEYDITDLENPIFVSEKIIPEHIQGITFADTQNGEKMLLSQGYQMDDAYLLVFDYAEDIKQYEKPKFQYTLPEGAEQIQVTDAGMYLLFESSARPYRTTARVINDQIYRVNMNFLNKYK